MTQARTEGPLWPADDPTPEWRDRPACAVCQDDGYLDESTQAVPVYCPACPAGTLAREQDGWLDDNDPATWGRP